MSTSSSSKTTTNQANAAATTTTSRRRSATSKNDNSNSNRGSSFKNDLIFVGIPFLLTQIFLFRKQIHYYTVGGSLQGGNSDSTSTTGTASSTLLDFDLPQQTTNQQEQQEQQQQGHSKQRKKRRKSSTNSRREPDAMFNGFPLYYHDTTATTATTLSSSSSSNANTTTSSSNNDNGNYYYYSNVHCIGETYNEPRLDSYTKKGRESKEVWKKMKDWSWMHRSCHFQFLCLDLNINEYVIYQDPNTIKLKDDSKHHDEIISNLLQERPTIDITQSNIATISNNLTTKVHTDMYDYGVSLGSINQKWNENGAMKLKWFPEIRSTIPTNFYTLPNAVIMIPFHSMAAGNPGHLVWDDFLPIYTLLNIFQMVPTTTTSTNSNEYDNNNNDDEYNDYDDNNDYDDPVINQTTNPNLLLLRYVLPESPGLWASCDFLERKTVECQFMHNKFGPLLLTNPNTTILRHRNATTKFTKLGGDDEKKKPSSSSNLICAKHGVAGIGSLTDHGTRKIHGWDPRDYTITHNIGRGEVFYNFRNYMLSNLGIIDTTDTKSRRKVPYKIIVSKSSSVTRSIDFSNEIKMLQRSLDPRIVSVEEYRFRDYTLKEQAQLMVDANILITGCGGGSVTGMFLPRGSTVILYYNSRGGLVGGRPSGTPARLDWDLFNNLSYVKVHWIPMNTKNNASDLKSLLTLIQHEILTLQHEQRGNQQQENQ